MVARRAHAVARRLGPHDGSQPGPSLEPRPPPELPDTAVWRAVATLSPRARTAVALRYVADLTEAQVADAMNVTRGTVATTLSRARRELADALCIETTGSPS